MGERVDAARGAMRRLAHSMIFLRIAGTYTPFALLVLHGTLATAILVGVWAGAVAGTIVEMIWLEAPKWVTAIIYLSLGWFAIVAFPELWEELGIAGTLLVGAGGVPFTARGGAFAAPPPGPEPAGFG